MKQKKFFEENIKELDQRFPEEYASYMLEYQSSKEYDEKIKEIVNYADQRFMI